jgi:anhydro-N-acetylmuramic acid kinase
LDPDWVEAIAFAWMAKQTLAGQRIETAAFTGATEPVILGGIYQA